MISDIVSIGDKLELREIKTKENTPNSDKVYVSQLLDFLSKDKACVAMPIEKGRVIPLSVGDKYKVCFFTSKGLYQCNAIITDRAKNNNIYLLAIQFLTELEKFQRREYYRIDCIIDIRYHIITDNEVKINSILKNKSYETEDEKNKYIILLEELMKLWYKGIIIDISGGGARFISGQQHSKDDLIQISMDLDSNTGIKTYVIYAKVISSIKMINRQGFFEHRVKYDNILKEDREAIIKYIFEEERRKRKKEKGLD